MEQPAPDLPTFGDVRPPASLPDPYRDFFECFNAGRYFEAHEVLEALWLEVRGRFEARFYQGLIQLAGAFVHLERGRSAPALALLRRSREHLAAYPDLYLGLDLVRLREQLDTWQKLADTGGSLAASGWRPQLERPDPRK